MALALRLSLLLLLAVALHARAAQAAPVPAWEADESAGNTSPLNWLREVLEPLEPPSGLSAGRTIPDPVLLPLHKPSSHGKKAAGATTRAPSIQESTGRGFCRGTQCLIMIMASMLGGQLAIMMCCVGIRYWRVRKRLRSAPAPYEPDTSGRKQQISYLNPPNLYPAVVPQLQNLQVQLPPKRATLSPSPLALHSSQL